MIKQLVLKDMMLQRKLGFAYLICLFFLAIVDFRSDSFLTTFSMFIPVLGMMLSMSYENKNKSEMIVNSLTVSTKRNCHSKIHICKHFSCFRWDFLTCGWFNSVTK